MESKWSKPHNPDMSTKHSYIVESNYLGRWHKLFEDTRDFCMGYLHARRHEAPRIEYRLVRSDGKVLQELKPEADVSIGMVAGWPTPEQYEHAAKRALNQAARIRAYAQQRTPPNPLAQVAELR